VVEGDGKTRKKTSTATGWS